MTEPRRPLHPPSAVKLAAAALAAQGQYGAVTKLGREHGVRRQQVYDIRKRGREALEAAFAADERATPGSFTLEVTPADIERTVVALRVVTPASIRDITAILPILYGELWSYGTVWEVLNRAERRAAAFLESVDLSKIHSVALDEMFSQGRPVLAGVDLDTQYLFQLEVQDSRSGEAWAKSLGKLRDEQGLHPQRVVKDAGTGLAAGVQRCWTGIDENDDLFHAVYQMGQEAFHLERVAYGAIARVEALIQRIARARNGNDRAKLGEALGLEECRMNTAIDRYDRFEALRREAARVLDLADRGSGRLRTPDEILETLTRVTDQMLAIDGKRILGVALYIRNRAEGLGRYLHHLSSRLSAATEEAGGVAVVEATVRAYQASLAVSQGGPAWDRKARRDELQAATRHLLAVTGREPERLQQAIGIVVPLLAHRYRASSAIENLNSVLRPYLVVQKHAEQRFLNLFRFHWNTRTREWGQWKGTSAYEILTGNKVSDWLTLLGFQPGEALAAAA
jgi:hypothetical protein